MSDQTSISPTAQSLSRGARIWYIVLLLTGAISIGAMIATSSALTMLPFCAIGVVLGRLAFRSSLVPVWGDGVVAVTWWAALLMEAAIMAASKQSRRNGPPVLQALRTNELLAALVVSRR